MITTYFKLRSEKMIPYKDAATDIREGLNIMNIIVSVLRPEGGNNDNFLFSKSPQDEKMQKIAN